MSLSTEAILMALAWLSPALAPSLATQLSSPTAAARWQLHLSLQGALPWPPGQLLTLVPAAHHPSERVQGAGPGPILTPDTAPWGTALHRPGVAEWRPRDGLGERTQEKAGPRSPACGTGPQGHTNAVTVSSRPREPRTAPILGVPRTQGLLFLPLAPRPHCPKQVLGKMGHLTFTHT